MTLRNGWPGQGLHLRYGSATTLGVRFADIDSTTFNTSDETSVRFTVEGTDPSTTAAEQAGFISYELTKGPDDKVRSRVLTR